MVPTKTVSFPFVFATICLKPLSGDNIVQEALFHLSQADISATSLDVDVAMDSTEASNDYQAAASSLRTSLQIFWDNATTEGTGVFSDFASFTRLSLADAAELVGEKATQAAESLRKVEGEVQAGERDAVGIKEQTKAEWKTADTREVFEKSMDTAKVAGSETIGAAQSVGSQTVEMKDRSQTRLKAAIATVSYSHSSPCIVTNSSTDQQAGAGESRVPAVPRYAVQSRSKVAEGNGRCSC
jgi:hypothetical protein